MEQASLAKRLSRGAGDTIRHDAAGEEIIHAFDHVLEALDRVMALAETVRPQSGKAATRH